jgi:hypothetical protein
MVPLLMLPECTAEPRTRHRPLFPVPTALAGQLAVGVWIAILVILCGRVLLKPRVNSVYPIFAEAGRHWLHGEALYANHEEPYRYSPLATVLFVPGTALADPVAGAVWRLLNAGVYLGALAWWARRVLPRPLTGAQVGSLFLLIVPLSVGSLNNGQSNPLVLGLLLLAVAGAAEGRWNLSAVCLALACLFKVYPIALGLLLAVVYPRQLASRLGMALLAGLALPFCFQEPAYVWAQYGSWLECLRNDDRQGLSPLFRYRDFSLLCQVWGWPLSSQGYRIVQLLMAIAAAASCLAARFAGWGPRRLLPLLLGLGCGWMTVFGSATESCTYILLAPPLAWGLLEAWGWHRPLWLRGGLVASYGLFAVASAVVWFSGIGRPVHALGVQPLAGLLYLGCLLVWELAEILQRQPAKFSACRL